MALPALAIPAILSAAAPWVMRFLAIKGVIMFGGFLGRLGLVLATNEFLIQPAIDHIMNAWASIPAGMSCWLNLFGTTKVASILVSGMTLYAGKKVFFSKA